MKRARATSMTTTLVVALLLAVLSAACQSTSPRSDIVSPESRLPIDAKLALAGGVTRWAVGAGPRSLESVEREVEAAGGDVRSVAGDGRLIVVSFPHRATAAEGVAAVAALPSVRYVEPDLKTYRALYVPSDARYPEQWGIHGGNSVHADTAWNTSVGSESVVIAVVDTGVDAQHADLRGRVDVQSGTNLVSNTKNTDDDNGHGTHVAGIAAASIDQGWVVGVAPGCTILPVKVLDAEGSGYPSDVANGVYYAVDHGAAIVNMSLGSDGSSASLAAACDYAFDHGVSVVAAAGNSSHSASSYPAAYPGVIGVGAIGADGARASFSNYGPQVDVCAPGVGILSCAAHGSARTMSGTSMAAPFAAGALAQIRSRWPSLTRSQAEAHLVATVAPKSQTTKNYYGAGLVNVGSAVSTVPEGLDVGEIGDGFPSTALSSVITTGYLDGSNTADVYAVALGSGQQVRATVGGLQGAAFDLRLCPPGSVNARLAIAGATGVARGTTLTYTVRRSGTYYLCVSRGTGDGQYSLVYRPGVALSRPYATATPRNGATRTWVGSIGPSHAVGSHPVTLLCYRRTAGAWRLRARAAATVTQAASGTRYAARVRLSSGRWRIVPAASADASHSATSGPSREITVR